MSKPMKQPVYSPIYFIFIFMHTCAFNDIFYNNGTCLMTSFNFIRVCNKCNDKINKVKLAVKMFISCLLKYKNW